MRGGELLQDQPSEQAREHAYGEEEAGPAGDPALAMSSIMRRRNGLMACSVMGMLLS